MALIEKELQDAHVDSLDLELDGSLVISHSTHSPTGILMQKDDNILKWLFYHTNSKKLKTYVEKFSELVLKGKMRFP